MTDELKGLELFLSSEKAVQGANTFRTAVESCAAAVERIGSVVDRLDVVLEHLGKTTKAVPPPLKEVGDKADDAATKMKKGAAGATELDRRLVGLAAVARGAAGHFTALAGSIGGLLTLRSAIGVIKESEDKLRVLQSVTGATAREMELLSRAANSLSLNTRFSFGDATQTLISLTKAGASAGEAMAALPTVSNLARAGILSLGAAGDTVIQTMAQFGLTINDAARIGDVLVKAADSTTSSVDTLADSLRKVGPVGREFGVSLETVTAAIAQLQQQGVEARIAGTGLSRIFQQLADPANGAEGAAQALYKLNLTFDDVHPRNFAKALDNLGAAGLTLKDAIALVGTEFGYLLTSMVRSRGEIKALDTALQSAGGDAAKKASATVGTLGDSIDRLGNAAERFYRQGGKAGLSRALGEIAVAGTDALNVLSGDAEAMANAGTAGTMLAGGLKVAGAAMAGIATFSVVRRVLEFERAMVGSGNAVSALGALVRANPLATIAGALAIAGTAFIAFSGSVDGSSARLEEFKRKAGEAEGVARRFDEIRLSILSGSAASSDALSDALRRELVELNELKKVGTTEVPADRVLGALQQQAPELVARIRAISQELARLSEAGKQPPAELRQSLFLLKQDVQELLGLELRSVGTLQSGLTGVNSVFAGLSVSTSDAVVLVGKALDKLSGKAGTAKDAIAGAAKASQDLQRGGSGKDGGAATEARRVDLLQQMIRDKVVELNLADQAEEKQRRAKILQEAQNAAIASGRKLRYEELLALEMIARQQDRIAGKKGDERRVEAVQKILSGLRNENDLLGQQGAAREALQKRQETLAALAEAKVATTSDEYQQALDLLSVYEEMLVAEEKRNQAAKGQVRRERRQDDAWRSLDEERELLLRTGAAREDYRKTIEATNEARAAGLEVGSAEFENYVRERKALAELAEAQERAADAGRQMGDSVGGALEAIIFDSAKARDALRSMFKEMARNAFRQNVTGGLSSTFGDLGRSLVNYFSSPAPSGGGTGPSGSGFNNGMGDPYNLLRGGVIPAMGGQVVDRPTFLQRAGRMYSIAEGGRSTPEGVLPLQRDQRGRLGVSAVGGGGGGGTTNMIFPGVRNRQDARAVRATMGQRASELRAVASRKGRRGLRP